MAALLGMVVLCTAGSGCSGGDRKEQGQVTLATVNGALITGDDRYLRLGGHADAGAALNERVLEDLINEELLYQKAVKLGLDRDQKYQDMVRQMERRVVAYKRTEMARRMRDTQIASKVNVTDQDIKEYYDRHAEQITTDLHLGILQFSDANKAKEALSMVRTGTSFEKIAAESVPQARTGGRPWDKGFLRWNQIPAELLDGVYSLKKGEVSEVLDAGKMGYFIVKVVDRRKNPTATLESMAPSVTNRLNAAKIAEAYDQYVRRLKEESSIKRF